MPERDLSFQPVSFFRGARSAALWREWLVAAGCKGASIASTLLDATTDRVLGGLEREFLTPENVDYVVEQAMRIVREERSDDRTRSDERRATIVPARR
jgi:hypothetical protein